MSDSAAVVSFQELTYLPLKLKSLQTEMTNPYLFTPNNGQNINVSLYQIQYCFHHVGYFKFTVFLKYFWD